MKWIILILGAALFLTNPSLKEHKQAISDVTKEVIKETKIDGIINLFGNGEDLLIKAIQSETKRDNYYLFSLTKIKIDNESSPIIIGIGILGEVYIFDDVKQELISQIELFKSGAGSLFKLFNS
jgi:hypothetical protein